MKLTRKISVFLFLLILFINIAHGENFSGMNKKSSVTLLKDGVIKVETLYRLNPNFDFFITSEAFRSSEKLMNIIIKINGNEIPNEQFEEVIFNGTFRYISLKYSLAAYTNINKSNEIYIKYETMLPNYQINSYQTNIDLLELSQLTKPQVDVNYELKIQSSENYLPIAMGDQQGFLVEYSVGDPTISRTYISRNLSDDFQGILITGLSFINKSLIRSQEHSRTIQVIDLNLIKEIYEYSDTDAPLPSPNNLLQFSISKEVNITKIPKIIVETDGKKYNAIAIKNDKFNEIIGLGKYPTWPFYYIGAGLNSNNNTIYIGYVLNEGSIDKISIEIEYDANKIITTDDGFNYVLRFEHLIDGFNYEKYLDIEIPKEFTIINTNYNSNLITKSSGESNNLRFYFKKFDEKNKPLEIKLLRPKTEFFNIIRYVNIILLCAIIGSCLLKKSHLEINNLENITSKLEKGMIPVSAFVLGIVFGNENPIDSFWYTYAWIPILITIIHYLKTE